VDAPDNGADVSAAAAHAAEGDSLRTQYRYPDAEAAYLAAIALDPGLPRAHSGLGLVLSDMRRFPEAEAACREAIRLDPALTVAHDNLDDLARARKRSSWLTSLRTTRRPRP
jgi:tetratricopeptide (TPR) repeat protein